MGSGSGASGGSGGCGYKPHEAYADWDTDPGSDDDGMGDDEFV